MSLSSLMKSPMALSMGSGLEYSNGENKCLSSFFFFNFKKVWVLELAETLLLRVWGKSFALGTEAGPCKVLLR